MLTERQLNARLAKLIIGWRDAPRDELLVRIRAIAQTATYHTLPVEVVTQWQLMMDKALNGLEWRPS